jgi:hypothetical protein
MRTRGHSPLKPSPAPSPLPRRSPLDRCAPTRAHRSSLLLDETNPFPPRVRSPETKPIAWFPPFDETPCDPRAPRRTQGRTEPRTEPRNAPPPPFPKGLPPVVRDSKRSQNPSPRHFRNKPGSMSAIVFQIKAYADRLPRAQAHRRAQQAVHRSRIPAASPSLDLLRLRPSRGRNEAISPRPPIPETNPGTRPRSTPSPLEDTTFPGAPAGAPIGAPKGVPPLPDRSGLGVLHGVRCPIVARLGDPRRLERQPIAIVSLGVLHRVRRPARPAPGVGILHGVNRADWGRDSHFRAPRNADHFGTISDGILHGVNRVDRKPLSLNSAPGNADRLERGLVASPGRVSRWRTKGDRPKGRGGWPCPRRRSVS